MLELYADIIAVQQRHATKLQIRYSGLNISQTTEMHIKLQITLMG